MDRKTALATLGLHEGATTWQIKRSYRRLAHRWHPDRNPQDPNSEQMFKEIQEAYRLLMDGPCLGKGRLRSSHPMDNREPGDPFLSFFEAVRRYCSTRGGHPRDDKDGLYDT